MIRLFFTLLAMIGLLSGWFVASGAASSEEDVAILRQRLAKLESENRALQKREAELLQELERLRASSQPEVAESATPPRRWETSLALGAALNSGNTESSLVTATASSTRKGDRSQLALKLDGQYGASEGTRNAERVLGAAQYDHDFSRDGYWLGRITGEYDAIKELDYRFTAGPGIGYRMINRDQLTLAWETGPGLQAESVAGQDQIFFQWRGGQRLDWRINSRFKVFETAEVLFNPFDWSERNAQVSLGIESGLTERLALRVVAQDRYQFNVPPDRQRHDFSLTSSVVWNF